MKFSKSDKDHVSEKHFETSNEIHQSSNILIFDSLSLIITGGTNQLTEIGITIGLKSISEKP